MINITEATFYSHSADFVYKTEETTVKMDRNTRSSKMNHFVEDVIDKYVFNEIHKPKNGIWTDGDYTRYFKNKELYQNRVTVVTKYNSIYERLGINFKCELKDENKDGKYSFGITMGNLYWCNEEENAKDIALACELVDELTETTYAIIGENDDVDDGGYSGEEWDAVYDTLRNILFEKGNCNLMEEFFDKYEIKDYKVVEKPMETSNNQETVATITLNKKEFEELLSISNLPQSVMTQIKAHMED